MPRYYKAPNKRIVPRGSNGRFRKATLQDFVPSGLIQNGEAICADCGYGSGEEKWFPLLKTGVCPKCGSKRKAVPGGSEKTDLELLEQFIQTGHPLLLQELVARGVITGYETESKLRKLLHFMKTGEKLEEPKPPSLMDMINRE